MEMQVYTTPVDPWQSLPGDFPPAARIDGLSRSLDRPAITGRCDLWQQSDNVPFEQSRNVPLTPGSLGGCKRDNY